jgi:hypothetical protein
MVDWKKLVKSGKFSIISPNISSEQYQLPHAWQMQRVRSLGEELKRRGYKPHIIVGFSKEAGIKRSELGYIVPRLSGTEAEALGHRYGQGSIITGSTLITTKGSKTLRTPFGKLVYGAKAKKMPYHTIITKRRKMKKIDVFGYT